MLMAKCPVQSHQPLWRIKSRSGDKKTILCLACEFEWDSKSKQYENLPVLTEEERKNHLIGKYD
jgi:hypothetical protein